jgi:hypothetical protein
MRHPVLTFGALIFLGGMLLLPGRVTALSADVHVPEKYTNVAAGDRFYFELEIKYPENPSRKDLRLEYDIEKNGEIIAQSKLLKAIETQASFMDYVVIPTSAESGMYTINVKITDYADLSEEASASFIVTAKNDYLLYYFLALFLAVVGFGVFISFEIARIKKDL